MPKRINNETRYVKYLLPSEFDALMRKLRKRKSPSFQVCFLVCAYMGLRISDATTLKLENVHGDVESLVYQDKKTGFPQDRLIPDILREELREYINRYKDKFKDGFLFFPQRKSHAAHLSPTSFRYFMSAFRKENGLDKPYYICTDGKKLYRCSFHVLKHYCAWVLYVASHNNIVFVQDYFNHQEMKHTLRYIRGMEAQLHAKEYINRAQFSFVGENAA